MGRAEDPSAGAAVFVSHAAHDRRRACQIAEALQGRGFGVWLDRWRLLGGQGFRAEIERVLERCGAVLVLWSVTSVTSDWVRAEAERGRARGVLIPVRLDDTTPPMPFGELHTLDLSGWDGVDPGDAGLRDVIASIAALTGRSATAPGASRPPWRLMVRALAPVFAAAVLAVLAISWLVLRPGLPVPVLSGIPVAVLLVGALVRATHTTRWLAFCAQGLCRAPGLAALALLVALLWSCTSVVIEADTASPDARSPLPLRATLSGPGGGAGDHRVLTAGEPVGRWLRLVPPWGRTVRVHVEGHEPPPPATIFPWCGARWRLGAELAPSPVLLVRLPDWSSSVAGGSVVAVEDALGGRLAQAVVAEDSLAVLVGGGEGPAPEPTAAWARELTAPEFDPGSKRSVLAGWARPTRTSWETKPLSWGRRLVILMTTPSGDQFASDPFPLEGVFTDEQPGLTQLTRK
jgi:hypothetical protein